MAEYLRKAKGWELQEKTLRDGVYRGKGHGMGDYRSKGQVMETTGIKTKRRGTLGE